MSTAPASVYDMHVATWGNAAVPWKIRARIIVFTMIELNREKSLEEIRTALTAVEPFLPQSMYSRKLWSKECKQGLQALALRASHDRTSFPSVPSRHAAEPAK